MDLLECCDVCGEEHNTVHCPELALPLLSTQNQPETRARLTLPSYLEVVENREGVVKVISKKIIERRTQLGPFEARRTTHSLSDQGFFTLKIFAKDGSNVVLDTTDENECNWMCLVQSAVSEGTQNCMAYQLGTNIFYNTTREIKENEELQVWYAPHYAKKMGKPKKPDPETKVLLGYRIEPFVGEEPDEELLETVESVSQQLPKTASIELPTGELVKIHRCPRCGQEYRTQSLMVQHLMDHILPSSTKSKNSQTPVAKGRGRPRKQHNFIDETESNTPKRKRGRPRKEHAYSHEEESTASDVYDSADESDETSEKKPKLEPLDSDLLDRDYSPLKEVKSSSRRVQPRRSLKGQHSKYGNDFVVDRLSKRVMITRIKEIDGEPVVEVNFGVNDSQTKASQQPVTLRRNRGRPRKYVGTNADDPKQHHRHDSIDDSSLSVNVPTKTYERKNILKRNKEAANDNIVDNSDLTVLKNIDFIAETIIKEEEIADKETDMFSSQTKEHINSFDVFNEDKNEKRDICEMSSNRKNLEQADVEKRTTSMNNQNSNDSPSKDSDMDEIPAVTSDSFDKEDETENGLIINEIEDETNENEKVRYLKTGRKNKPNESEKVRYLKAGSKNKSHPGTNNGVFIDASCDPENSVAGENDKKSSKDIISENIIIVVEKEGIMYKCGICEKLFEKMNYLKLHIPKHTDKYKCENCGKTFARPDSLQKHKCRAVKTLLEKPIEEVVTRVEQNDKEQYNCAVCQEKFDLQIEAISHYLAHCEDGQSCSKYGKVSGLGMTKSALDFQCDICGQGFSNAKYLHRHLVMHTDLFKCIKCKFCFSRKDSLQKHVMKCCPEFADSYRIKYCNLCYRVFSTRAGKLNHVAKCKYVKCEKCSRVFSCSSEKESHDCYTEEKIPESSGIEFSCGKCGKSFLNHYYLLKHQVIHKDTFQCNICKKSLRSQEELRNHVTVCELVQKIRLHGVAKCDLCEEMFTQPKALRLHHHSHTHPYQCGDCEKRFMKESGLTGHSCKSVSQTFDCTACDNSFTSRRFLSRHMTFAHSNQVYKCGYCGKDFNRRMKYQNHICKFEDGTYGNIRLKKGKRTELEKLVCDICGKTFSSRSNLNKHTISHGEKRCSCRHCGKMFHYETYLREHISSVHFNIYKYQCVECGKLMKSKTGLVQHVKQFHVENSQVFTCEKCGKTFKQKGNLQTHMYSHQEERNFICEYCHKTYKYPDQLSRHKLFHTMVNKLRCSYCDKYFVKDYELKRHEMVFHSGLVYVCAVCSARCGHKHTLIRHYKRKHPGSVEELTAPGVIDAMLKRNADLPVTETVETLEVEQELEPQLITEIDLMSGPVMPPQDAAEVLHSLSNAKVMIEPLSEHKKPKAEPEILTTVEENPAIQIQLQPAKELKQYGLLPPGAVQLAQGPVASGSDQPQLEVKLSQEVEIPITSAQAGSSAEESVIINSAMININGQFFPLSNLQAIPQAVTEEGQIVILQILDPQAEEQGPQMEAQKSQEEEQGTEEEEQETHEEDQGTQEEEQGTPGEEQELQGEEQGLHGDEKGTQEEEQGAEGEEQRSHGEEQGSGRKEQGLPGEEQRSQGQKQESQGQEQGSHKEEQGLHKQERGSQEEEQAQRRQ